MIGGGWALAFTKQWHMDAHEICLRERLLEAYILNPGLLFLNAARVPKVHDRLYRFDVFVILICGVIAQNVHIKPGAFLNHGQADSPRTDDGDRFASDLVAKKRKVWM